MGSVDNHHQKQKRRCMKLFREVISDTAAQDLIEELENMTDLDDDDDDDGEGNENEDQIKDKRSNPPIKCQVHLDPVLQNKNQKTHEETDQISPNSRPKPKANQNDNSHKRAKSESDQKPSFSNPRKGKRPNLNRDHSGAQQKLMRDFFQLDDTPNNPDQQSQLQNDLDCRFHSKFHLSKKLFLKIVNDLSKNDPHFIQRKDALGNLGHSTYQKVLAAIRQLTHGIGNQAVIMDDYIRMADSTALECLIRFCHNINELYGLQYLRNPNESDLRGINETNVKRGIPNGFMGSLGFKYWQWETRPTGWSGRFKSTSSSKPLPTIVLEALVSPDSRFWYAFFSTPGNCKDIDVFHPNLPIYSPKFQVPQLPSDHPLSSQSITGFYHAHSIYPPIGPIVTSINTQVNQNPILVKQQQLVDHQFHSICNDDFEQAILKLESRFQIIKLPCRLWSSNSMKVVIQAVMTLHNMIIEDEQIHRGLSESTDLNLLAHLPPQPTSTTPPQLGINDSHTHQDIQVNPVLPDPTNVDSPPNIIPPHVLQTLNNRFQFFNPDLSLRL